MNYVKVTIDGSDVYLQQLYDGSWSILSEPPSYPGQSITTLIFTIENNVVTIYGTDDVILKTFVESLILGKSRTNLVQYLPTIMQDVAEFKAIMNAEDFEIDLLHDGIQLIADDSYILTAREARIAEWERAFEIIPYGTLAQRKSFLISFLIGQGKLNEAKIKSVVKGFTGGDSIITFGNSALSIKILVPPNGDIYRFPDVARALRKRLPAHIGLSVQRFYATWNDIKTDFASWGTVSTLNTDWEYVKNYLPGGE